MNAKKKDGTDYEPDTLTSNHRAIERYLRDQNYPKNILTDPDFETSRRVLLSRRKMLKGNGLGNKKNKSESLTSDDEELMWSNGSLGTHNPDVLQETVWYLMSKLLDFRGCQEARQLALGDLECKTDENNQEYFEWTEKITKTRQGNSTKS